MRSVAIALFCVAVVVAAAPAASPAGTIGFRTDAKVTAGPGVDVKVILTHTGDEVAEDVRVRAELLGHHADGAVVPALGPKQTHSWNLHLADEIPPGVYAVVLRTRYADTNGYPFEVISTATARVGVKPVKRIFGNFSIPRLRGKARATARFTAKRPPGRSGNAEVEIVVPAGLEVAPTRLPLEFDDTGRAKATFRIQNRKLLPGTAVNVFGLVHATDAGFEQVDTVRGNVHITAAAARVSSPMFYQAAGAMFLLLALLEAGSRYRGRRSTTA